MLLQVQTTPHQQPLATLHFELALCSLCFILTGGTLGPMITASENVLDNGSLTQDPLAPHLLSLGFKLDCMSLPLQLPVSVFHLECGSLRLTRFERPAITFTGLLARACE